ncbi:hypothetical protein [Pedobacter sp. JCM 36344]|uniref:hypothetical protein n=1 Tax=Pedobacter sp. JCM 36344 TaxID=3374280 RepID=UPI00397B6A82
MKKRFNFKAFFTLLAAFVLLVGLSSCAKEMLRPDVLSGDRLISSRLDGTWTKPTNIVTPTGVPPGVFGAMRLVFTTDESGNPSKFIGQDCPIVFSNAVAGAWRITGNADSAQVNLIGVGPVDDFKVKVSANSLNLSFFMGWENTDTKATGKGNFKVTLSRQ